MSSPLFSISVVSHLQMKLIQQLLDDLQTHCGALSFELLLTLNLPEKLPFDVVAYSFPVKIIENPLPKGFGANHNQAYAQARGRYFCVLNPDIRLLNNPFLTLQHYLDQAQTGLVAPVVMDDNGNLEDSVRLFPSPFTILFKAMRRQHKQDYPITDQLVYPEWVAGMFMLFRAETFAQLNGFDERFFLYYEDVNLCARLHTMGLRIVVCPQVRVIHLAHRESHRNFKYMRWHLSSMARYFFSSHFLRCMWRRFQNTHPPQNK